MADRKTAKRTGGATTAARRRSGGFTDSEKGAMRDRVREIRSGDQADEAGVLENIAGMSARDRELAQRFHSLVMRTAPSLTPRLWYGMPAYAKDGKIICHFQPADKFKTRYATFGFSDRANLDEGAVWPVAYAVKELKPGDEARIAALVSQAVG